MNEVRVHEFPFQMAVVAACIFVIAGTLVPGVPLEFLRFVALAVLAAQVWVERRATGSLFLTSPPFLLAAIPTVFFSVLPGLLSINPIGRFRPEILSYIGSDAERIILVFSMAALVIHGVVCRFAVSSLRQSGGGLLSHTKMTFSLVAVFSSVLFLTYGALIWMADSFPWASSIFGPFKTFAIPTLAFLMICLVRWAADGGWGLKVLTITMFAATVAVLIVTREGKIPIFMVLAGWLYWLRLKNVPFRNIFLSGLAVILLAISLIQISQIIRTPHVSMLANLTDDNPILRVLVRKAVWRQTETGYCLLNVIDAHGDTPLQASRQLFWLEGLVPRALWPDKPNMSKGDDYATDYCKFIKGRAPSPTGRHSASITLLGQPIIHGGMTGLILHGGLLLFGLGGLAWATRSPGSLSSLTVVALLPWWIDFDQDFVLYVANLVKFFLIMLPMIFIVAFLDNNRKDEIP